MTNAPPLKYFRGRVVSVAASFVHLEDGTAHAGGWLQHNLLPGPRHNEAVTRGRTRRVAVALVALKVVHRARITAVRRAVQQVFGGRFPARERQHRTAPGNVPGHRVQTVETALRLEEESRAGTVDHPATSIVVHAALAVVADHAPSRHVHDDRLPVAQLPRADLARLDVLVAEHLVDIELLQGIVAALLEQCTAPRGQVVDGVAVVRLVRTRKHSALQVVARKGVTEDGPVVAQVAVAELECARVEEFL